MITIYDWFGYELPYPERCRLIREAGFDGVLMWWSEDLGRGRDYRSGPETARKAGLFVENIHAPFALQDDIWRDMLDGEAAENLYLQCVADCAAFEIPTLVIHLPGENLPCTPGGLDRIRRIIDRAERLEVCLAFENLRNLPNLDAVLSLTDSERVGFCYDCGHHYRYYPERDLLAAYGPRIKALHLHDNDGAAMHRLPLDGEIDWRAAMRQIAKTGYSGPTAIEAMNWDYRSFSPAEFLRRAAQNARTLQALRRNSDCDNP